MGNKKTIVLHNCEINNQKHDLKINPHTQTVGNIRTNRQTIKRRIKKQYKHKPVHLYNWNQPNRHIDNYILTVIKRKNEPHSK